MKTMKIFVGNLDKKVDKLEEEGYEVVACHTHEQEHTHICNDGEILKGEGEIHFIVISKGGNNDDN